MIAAELRGRRVNWANTSDEARRYSFPEMLGDPINDAQMLDEISPLAQVERLKVPVLLAYGAQDRRVTLAQGEQMRNALRRAGNEPEWVVYADEGHNWLRPDNRFDFARRLERFLAQHLK